MEGGCKVLDELSEVHALVGNVVEDGLVSVTLVFDVADFHLQTEVFGYLSALDHGAVLAAFGLVVLVHVCLFGQPVDALDVVFRLEVCLFDLQLDEPSRERDDADVVSGIGFHGHDVAFLERQVVDVVVVALACVLELHFHEVCVFVVAGHVGQPVVGVELVVLSAHGASAEPSVAGVCYFVFQVLIVHFILWLMFIYIVVVI